MKAQVSIEHLMIIGIAVLILIPATMLFYNYAKGSNQEVVESVRGHWKRVNIWVKRLYMITL